MAEKIELEEVTVLETCETSAYDPSRKKFASRKFVAGSKVKTDTDTATRLRALKYAE